jgi:hypothetical protein
MGAKLKQQRKKKQLTNYKLKLQSLQNKTIKIKTRRENNIKQLKRLKKSLTKEKIKVLRV